MVLYIGFLKAVLQDSLSFKKSYTTKKYKFYLEGEKDNTYYYRTYILPKVKGSVVSFPILLGTIKLKRIEKTNILIVEINPKSGREKEDIKKAYSSLVKSLPGIYYINSYIIFSEFFKRYLKGILSEYNLYIQKIDFLYITKYGKIGEYKGKEYVSKYGSVLDLKDINELYEDLKRKGIEKIIPYVFSITDRKFPIAIFTVKRSLIAVTDYGLRKYEEVIEQIKNKIIELVLKIENISKYKTGNRVNNKFATSSTIDIIKEEYYFVRNSYLSLLKKEELLKLEEAILSNPISYFIAEDKEGRIDIISLRKEGDNVEIYVTPFDLFRNTVSPVIIDKWEALRYITYSENDDLFRNIQKIT